MGRGERTKGLFAEGLRSRAVLIWKAFAGGKVFIAPVMQVDLHGGSCTPTKVQHQEESLISLLQITF